MSEQCIEVGIYTEGGTLFYDYLEDGLNVS